MTHILRDVLSEIEKDSNEPPKVSGSIDRLILMGEEMEILKGALDEIREEQKEKNARYDELRKTLIPEEMAAVGLVTDAGKGKFSLASGATIHLRGDLFAAIKSDQKEEAHTWLADNGHGSIVKPTVNPQTLRAFAKEQLEEGKELPHEFFNVHPFSTATLRRGK